MARKSRPANSGADAAAVRGVDLIAAVVSMAAGALVAVWLIPGSPRGNGSCTQMLCVGLGYAAFSGFAMLLARVDRRSHTLPNGLVLTATLCTGAPLTIASVVHGERLATLLPWAAAAGMALLAFALWAGRSSVVGGGDVKLMPVAAYAGIWPFGPEGWLSGTLVFGALLLGMLAVGGLAAILRGRRELAAGPLMLAPAAAAALLGALSG